MFAKVKGHENLIRDMNSKAILNTDKVALQDYYHKRDLARKEQSDKMETKQRLENIETDMAEIKNLLHSLLATGSK